MDNFNPIERQLVAHVESGYQADYEAIEQLFEENKQDIGKNAMNFALHALCSNSKTSGNHLDIMNLLLTKNVDVNWKNNAGATPLMICAKKGSVDLLDALLKSEKIKVDATDQNKKTALFYAIESDFGENLNIISILINRISNINQIDSKGKSVLMIAVEKGSTETVKLLLNNGADTKIKGAQGEDITQLASKRGFLKIKEILENHIQNQASQEAAWNQQPQASTPHGSRHKDISKKEATSYERFYSNDNLSVQAKVSERSIGDGKSLGSIDLDKQKTAPNHQHMGKMHFPNQQAFKNIPLPNTKFKQPQEHNAMFNQPPQMSHINPPNQFPGHSHPNLQSAANNDWRGRGGKEVLDGADHVKHEPPAKHVEVDVPPSQQQYNQTFGQNQKSQKLQTRIPNNGNTLLKELTPSGNLGYPPTMRSK